MRRSWTRAAALDAWLSLAGWLGIAGMGALLFHGGRGGEAPRLASLAWFVVFAAAPLAAAGHRLRRRSGNVWAWAVLVATAGLGISGWKLADPSPDAATRADTAFVAMTTAAARLEQACSLLTPWGKREASALPDPETEAARGGAVFRAIEPLPGRWARTERGGGLPLSVAVWRGGQCVAWTAEALPLPAPGLVAPDGESALTWFRERWVVRRLQPGTAGQILELQMHLPTADLSSRDPVFDVISQDSRSAPLPGTVEVDADGPATPLVVQVTAPRETTMAAWQAGQARLYAAMLAMWAFLLVGSARWVKYGPAWLAALWVARGFLAAVDLRRWIVAALPSAEYPAAPGSWLSLIDPAYFATPVLRGWFASTADAFLTSVLVAVTVAVVVSRPPVAPAPRQRSGGWLGGRIGWLAFAYAALAATVLALMRSLAFLLATNANPRMIGAGAALSYLSFWGLHLVLLLMSLSGLGLLVAAAGRRPPAGRRLTVAAGAAAALAAGTAVATLTEAGPGVGALAAALTAVIWISQTAGPARTPVWRRLAWPVLVLASASWNYVSLTQVRDAAERAWLDRRAGAITEADAGWMRYLVQSVLQEMQEADEVAAPAPASALWRDEAAWRLYQGSALHDLGYPCLVEVMDERERTSSLFATGFLRDFRFETLARSPWGAAEPGAMGAGSNVVFQDERRRYSGGQEDILVAEAPRRSGRGWLRVEAPLRSWRISTLQDGFGGDDGAGDQYRPRAEVDRPVLILLADDRGWLGSGAEGFPDPAADAAIADLRAGRRAWAEIPLGEARWQCRWSPLPETAARSRGEGFVLGIRRPTPVDTLLDFSRLVLVDLVALLALWAVFRWGRRWPWGGGGEWKPGFQEKFLAGYLALGLLLLLVVGLSVDRLGYQRVRGEARQQARDGLTMAVQQLGALLADQARALAESEQVAALLRDPTDREAFAAAAGEGRQAVLFGDDGTVLFDGSFEPLSAEESKLVLAAARAAPMVLFQDDDGVWAGVGVPVDLGGVAASLPVDGDAGPGHGGTVSDGLFFYRQRLDAELLAGLADVLQGEVTLSLDGAPEFASHPEGLFAGRRPQLLDPGLMATLFDHPQGPGLASPPGRPFACDAAQPLPALARDRDGNLARRAVPAVLGVSFPGREREYAAQRRSTVLFLAGLANLILLTALLLAALMSWNLFRPLRVLSAATRSLAAGDYSAPLPPAGRDEVGRLAAAFGAMRAQVQLARDDLAQRERFLATVLERVTVGVAVLTPSGELVVLNPAGRAILARFRPGEAPQAAAARLLEGLGSGDPRVAAGEMVSDDGRLTLRGAVAPLDDGATTGDQMVVFEDVSEFLATKKLALNAELARQVAHEIKNPLTPIRLSIQLLGQAWQDRHPQLERIVPETVARVLEQVDLLRRIASEFSLLGRPDELPRLPVDLPAVVAKVSAAYTGAGDGEVVVRGAAPAGLPPVLAHEESLLKILGNLMQNSMDAARPGVAPVVETEWGLADGRVRLFWRDNGAGLPTDVADRLFEPYFSTKSKGTGLGLAICRSLAERMGGRISLGNRRDGPGAEAVLELPVAANAGETV